MKTKASKYSIQKTVEPIVDLSLKFYQLFGYFRSNHLKLNIFKQHNLSNLFLAFNLVVGRKMRHNKCKKKKKNK